VNWAPPGEDGGLPILGYKLLIAPPPWDHKGPILQGLAEVYDGASTSLRIPKLSPGVPYCLQVQGRNAVGLSQMSEASCFTTAPACPLAPLPPIVTAATAHSVALAWMKPDGQGAEVSGYTVEMSASLSPPSWTWVADICEGDTCCVVGGLHAGVTYLFRVLAQNHVGKSGWSGPVQATTAATPPVGAMQPEKLGSTVDTLTVGWDPPENNGGSPVQGYEVEVQTPWATNEENLWHKAFMVVAEECTLRGLRSGSQYLIRTRALNHMGTSAPSRPADLRTLSSLPEGPPQPPSVTNLTRSWVSLEWQAPMHDGGAPILAYHVDAAYFGLLDPEAGDGSAQAPPLHTFHTVHSGPELTANISGLVPGAMYMVRVSGENRHGFSPPSPPLQLNTPASPPCAPDPPRLVPALLRAKGLTLMWDPPKDNRGAPVTQYHLDMAPHFPMDTAPDSSTLNVSESNGGDSSAPLDSSAPSGPTEDAPANRLGGKSNSRSLVYERKYSGAAPSCEIADLSPSTTYSFRLQACSHAGASEWSKPACFTTLPAPPTAPTHPRVSNPSTQGCRVSWSLPRTDHGASIQSFSLEVAPADTSSSSHSKHRPNRWEEIYNGPELHYSVKGLASGRRYVFRVRARNSVGTSPVSESVFTTTAPAPPDPPGVPTFTLVSAHWVKVAWSPPVEDHGAVIQGYSLQLWEGGGKEPVPADKPRKVDIMGGLTTYKAGKLNPSTEYNVRVQVLSSAGTSHFSPTATTSTLKAPPLPPLEVSAELVDHSSARVTWDEPTKQASTAGAVSYQVDMAANVPLAMPAEQDFHPVYSGATREFLASQLKADMQYTFRVRSNGGEGHGFGLYSKVATVATPTRQRAENTSLDAETAQSTGLLTESKSARKRKQRKGAAATVTGSIRKESPQGQRSSAPLRIFVETIGDLLGVERWMGEEKRQVHVASMVAERQRKAAEGKSYRPPRIKKWYEKQVVKQTYRMIFYVVCFALVVLVILWLKSMDWNTTSGKNRFQRF